jgi:uncharacterized membrane protein
VTVEVRKPRENTVDKAKRLLLTGRLRVTKVDGNVIEAICRGDSGEIYWLAHDPNDVPFWSCSCPARKDCSHLRALWAVVVVER